MLIRKPDTRFKMRFLNVSEGVGIDYNKATLTEKRQWEKPCKQHC